MLTSDKTITTPQYWDKVYSGENKDAKVDSSNTLRPAQPFDRFDIVVKHVLPSDAREKRTISILDIGSGHAHICKRLSSKFRPSLVIASDQAPEAREVAKYEPYYIFSGYKIPYPEKFFDMVICTQAIEYFEDQEKLLTEISRVGRRFISTVPDGEMQKWSQLRIYTEENFKQLLEKFGTIEVFEKYPGLMLAKIKFKE